MKRYLWRGRYAPFDLFPYEWAIDKPIDGALSGLSSITSNASLITKELLANEKITASYQTNMSPRTQQSFGMKFAMNFLKWSENCLSHSYGSRPRLVLYSLMYISRHLLRSPFYLFIVDVYTRQRNTSGRSYFFHFFSHHRPFFYRAFSHSSASAGFSVLRGHKRIQTAVPEVKFSSDMLWVQVSASWNFTTDFFFPATRL